MSHLWNETPLSKIYDSLLVQRHNHHVLYAMAYDKVGSPRAIRQRRLAYQFWKEIERRAMTDYRLWRVNNDTLEQYFATPPGTGCMG